jgi:hypothetical protein
VKKVTIEIEYDEEKDLFFHLGIIRTQLKTLFKNKVKNKEDDQLLELRQETLGGSHTIEFKD